MATIGRFAFYGCSGLTAFEYPANYTGGSVERYTFGEATALKEIIIPSSVTTIGDNAFYGCSTLESVTFSEGLTGIGEHSFQNCAKITEISLPQKLTSIGTYAFSGCTGVTKLVVPDSVESIGTFAFYGMPLTEVSLPFVGCGRNKTTGKEAIFGAVFGYTSSNTGGTTKG